MPTVPRQKYPEMNWRAADKVAAWKLFKRRMNVIFMADQIPEERQWALILVAGGDKAYNCWDTLEETVMDHKQVEQVWNAFEKSFEQSTSFWHFRDAYLADFRQDKSETMADLDLRIKQTVRGCQWKKETEEEQMIDLPYHATIYYEICKFVQESEPAALTYELVRQRQRLMSIPFLSTKTIKLPTGEQTACLPTIIHCYLLMHCLKDGPVAVVIMANVVANVANLMSEATAPHMGKLATSAKVLITSKLFVIPRLQPRWHRALTKARSHTRRDMVPWGATAAKAKEVATVTPEEEDPKEATEAKGICSDVQKLSPIRSNNYIWWRERETG